MNAVMRILLIVICAIAFAPVQLTELPPAVGYFLALAIPIVVISWYIEKRNDPPRQK